LYVTVGSLRTSFIDADTFTEPLEVLILFPMATSRYYKVYLLLTKGDPSSSRLYCYVLYSAVGVILLK
jgi:hypothetical protein